MRELRGRAYESLRDFIFHVQEEALYNKVKAERKANRVSRPAHGTAGFVLFEEVMEQRYEGSEGHAGGAVKWVITEAKASGRTL